MSKELNFKGKKEITMHFLYFDITLPTITLRTILLILLKIFQLMFQISDKK